MGIKKEFEDFERIKLKDVEDMLKISVAPMTIAIFLLMIFTFYVQVKKTVTYATTLALGLSLLWMLFALILVSYKWMVCSQDETKSPTKGELWLFRSMKGLFFFLLICMIIFSIAFFFENFTITLPEWG